MKLILVLVLGSILYQHYPLSAQDWLQWGGPCGDFNIQASGLAEEWPEEGPRQLWKRSLGEGYSSILHKDGKLYTMYGLEDQEVVVSLDAKTGSTIWEYSYPRKFWSDMRMGFGWGPNATPLIMDNKIITAGIAGDIHCLNLNTGKLLWKHDLTKEYGRRERVEEYGYSMSPLRYKNTVIVHVGGDDHGLVAFNPNDGSVIWESDPDGVSYAQASIIKLAGQDQFIYFSPEGVNGLDPVNGKKLWHHTIPISNGNNLTPIVQCDQEHIFVSSQFDNGGGRLLRVTNQGDKMKVKEIWFNSALQSSCWTHFRIGDYIYGSAGSHAISNFNAFEWRTGKIVWSHRKLMMAQCLYADDKVIMQSQRGTLALAKVTPENFDVLCYIRVLSKPAWTLPTLVGTKLFMRDRKNILAVELSNTP